MRSIFATPQGRLAAFTRPGFGGAPLGNMHRALSEVESEATVRAAWDAGLRYFDTAPLYGHGLSETRIGRALAGEARADFIVSTKVGRVLEPCAAGEEAAGIYRQTPPLRVRFDYTELRRRAALGRGQPWAKLGLDRVYVLYVHDLEPGTHRPAEAYEARWRDLTDGGGWRALDELRSAGAVAAIGLGVNQIAPCERMLAELDPDLFLLAGRWAHCWNRRPGCWRRVSGAAWAS